MQLTVKGKHLDVGDSLREHVRMSLSHTAEKYFRNPIDATVVFTKEKGHRYRADISVHIGGGIVLQAQHESNDPYPAFDQAAERMATRLRRYKEKLRDHHRWEDAEEMHMASYTAFQANENDAVSGAGAATIAEMETPVQTLAVADAVMRLELGDLPALLFKNPSHGGYNMVYRRKDGNIGWVDPRDGGSVKTQAAKPASKKAPAKKPAPAAKARPKKPAASKPAAKKAPAKKPVLGRVVKLKTAALKTSKGRKKKSR